MALPRRMSRRTLWRTVGVIVGIALFVVAIPSGLAAADSDWSPGPGAAGAATYDGFVDAPVSGATIPLGAAFLVTGWVVDRTAQGWAGIDDLHVYDEKAGEGGTFLASGSVAQDRPDVAAVSGNPYWAASGFFATVPGTALGAGSHTLTVYAHTPAKGWWFKQVAITVAAAAATPVPTETPAQALKFSNDPLIVVQRPSEDDEISTTGTDEYNIKGLALDRNATEGSGVDRVEVYLGGPRGNGEFLGTVAINQEIGTGCDYGAQFCHSGWNVPFKPTNYANGDTNIWVYARSSVTGRETSEKVDFTLVD